MSSGWIGVDLDGTLAEYNDWRGEAHIGEPVPAMLERVKRWLREGRTVKIMTARCYHDGSPRRRRQAEVSVRAIRRWCTRHLGRALEVTCVKDFNMTELWDDRAVQVEKNTGRRIDGKS